MAGGAIRFGRFGCWPVPLSRFRVFSIAAADGGKNQKETVGGNHYALKCNQLLPSTLCPDTTDRVIQNCLCEQYHESSDLKTSYAALKRARLYKVAKPKRRKPAKTLGPYYGKVSKKKELFARRMRRNPTPAEAYLAEILLYLPDVRFNCQVPIIGYIADFASGYHRLVVEVDGLIHTAQRQQDRQREHNMLKAGWKTIRFTNEQVLKERPKVIAEILRHCKSLALSTRTP